MKDIYKIIISEDKLNKKFKLLTESSLFDPAKKIIKNICLLINDQDGNFIKDFQSTGFDARLWEIYLYIFLLENKFPNRPHMLCGCFNPAFEMLSEIAFGHCKYLYRTSSMQLRTIWSTLWLGARGKDIAFYSPLIISVALAIYYDPSSNKIRNTGIMNQKK